MLEESKKFWWFKKMWGQDFFFLNMGDFRLCWCVEESNLEDE